MPERITFETDESDAGERLDVAAARRIVKISRSRLRRLIESGAVLVDGHTVKPSGLLHAGEWVEVTLPDPVAAEPEPQEIPLRVVLEDDDLLVVDKPAGLVVHPGAGTPDGTMVNALLARPGSLSEVGGVLRPGIVHRLDKDTSGLILVARTDLAHRTLSAALARREVSRVYWALALRRFPKDAGEVNAPVGRHPSVRTRMAVVDRGGRDALTRWQVLEPFGGISLVECRLGTGRTHQIRVHLAHIGHPVLGDTLYGGSPAVAQHLVATGDTALRAAVRDVRRQMLHAHRLSFQHPRTGERIQLESPPPADFDSVLALLRLQSLTK
jgi:23S rRNA pseudouridine1911/1915/1917 synthase